MFADIDLGAFDTDKPGHYLETYARAFGHLRLEEISMLELGVQRGGSILLWQELLPNAKIAGLDLNPVELVVDPNRVKIYQGFQQDPAMLDRIASEIAPDGFDVVIDDASHLAKYTSESFWHIFPNLLKPGGVYIIDDWDCAYRTDWPDGRSFRGDLQSITPPKKPTDQSPGLIERGRRNVRSAARPIARRLSPDFRQRLEPIYMKLEGATLGSRYPSHDYGMAGFGKQLVDACSVDHILGPGSRMIESVHFTPNQIVVRKTS